MTNHCRIFGIMAREAPVCVLFRRGPSKWTQLILWHTDSDAFELGHWFHGRIYEHRCDLSPDGRYLIYFAAKINRRTLQDTAGYTYAWTAISQPPKYNALTLWPKGDCWHGGGLFESNRKVWLNHRPEVAIMHPNHVSSLFKVTPNPEACGEDAPVFYRRLLRDGWTCVRPGIFPESGVSGWDEQTEVWERPGRSGKKLRRELLKIDFDAYGGPYIETCSLVQKSGIATLIPEADWADLDLNGKLVFAWHGKLFRGVLDKDGLEETELIDLNTSQPVLRNADNSKESNSDQKGSGPA